MNSKPRILVLGGHGFIGRHAIEALNKLGHTPTIGTRAPQPNETQNVQRKVCFEDFCATEDWLKLTEEYDVVLNCVGILRPTATASYQHIHHQTPRCLAYACAQSATRFVHVSALGLESTDRSAFLTTKLAGEMAIQDTTADWIIVRPSLLDGEGGYGAAWLRGVARLPIFLRPSDAQGAIAALAVKDLGIALAQLCVKSATALNLDHSRIYELGGTTTYTFEQYIRALRTRHYETHALAIPLPSLIARLGAHICDGLRFSPFSFGHWELLRKDNVPAENRLPELLGHPPRDVIRNFD